MKNIFKSALSLTVAIGLAVVPMDLSWAISEQDTLEREAKALVKLSSFMPCNRLLIITKDEEKTINIDGKEIKVTPIWKWLLNEL